MKPVKWNDGTKWGNINARWGSPSYLLEPGDPGYQPDPLSTPNPTTPKKKHTMPKQAYLLAAEAAFAGQLNQFKTGITPFVATFGLSAGQVSAQAADADYYASILACQLALQEAAQKWTAWKNTMRNGGPTPPGGVSPAPVFPTLVAAVLPGIEARFRALVAIIKVHPNYTPAIGEGLGIEGPVLSPPPAADFKPVLVLSLVGGNVFIKWGWEGHSAFLDAIEIQVDRADGHGWVMLVIDTTPNYTDTTPLPTPAAKWKYRGIYRVGDARTGQWSDEVSITVGA